MAKTERSAQLALLVQPDLRGQQVFLGRLDLKVWLVRIPSFLGRLDPLGQLALKVSRGKLALTRRSPARPAL